MSWKDKNGKNLENEDTVIVEGKISGRHSSDRISVTVAPGQTVLIDASICRKGKSKPEPEVVEEESEPEPEVVEEESEPEPEVVEEESEPEGGDVAPASGGDVAPAEGGDVAPAEGGEGEG
jgi:ABC-2 type transport system ATP-binding protein